MNNSKQHINKVRATLLVAAAGLYYLAGILFNPLIVWTASPILIGYSILAEAWKTESAKKLCQGYCYLIFSLGFSYFYHFSWFFDWGGQKTGGSTSALIFAVFPIYAIILGFFGYLLGSMVSE